jgi:hypothetical protein
MLDMKRSAIIGALMLSTSLVAPQKAQAGPVLGFLGGAFLGGTVGGLGLAFTGLASGAFVAGAAFASSVVGRLLISAGLSYISKALMPQPNIPAPSARMANFAQPITYAEWVFGRTRKGGPLGFTAFSPHVDVVTGTGGAKRHYTVILAAHPIKGVVQYYLDDRTVDIDSDGLVVTAPMAGYYRVRPFNGDQVADDELVAAFPEITTAHDFKGLSGAHLWAARPPQSKFSDVYPTGRQGAYTPVIDGHNGIYDPRTDTFGFTRNAALIIAHWLTAVLGQSVDWDEVAIEADVCDEPVTNRTGATQPRWRLDGTISDEMEFDQQRAQLAGACDAFIYERADGKVGFHVGRWIEPEITLTQADFFSFEMTLGTWGSGAPTEVAATYVEPNNKWREAPSGPYVVEENERQVRDTPTLAFSSSHNQTWRMNVRLAKTKRPKYQLQGTVGILGYALQGHRFIRVENEEMGVSEYFEIGELYRNEGGFTFNIVANSVDPADFNPDAVANEPEPPKFEQVASDNIVPPVVGLTGETISSDGMLGGVVKWSWPDQDESLRQRLSLVVRGRDGEPVQQIVDVPPGQSFYLQTSLADSGASATIRNVTAAQRVSDWEPDPPISVSVLLNQTPPAALDAFAAAVNALNVDVTFVAPNDPNYFAARIWRADGSTVFGDAVLVRTEYGIPSNSDVWTDIGPGAGDHTYWAAPINESGVEGPMSGPVTVTI